VDAKDWNALIARLEALEGATPLALSDDDPIMGDATAYEGVGTDVSRDDHVHPDLNRNPDYDSGWFALAQNTNVNKAHGRGTDQCLVILIGRTGGSDIHKYHGGWSSGGTGAWWQTLTSTNVNINRGIADIQFINLRVFVWELS